MAKSDEAPATNDAYTGMLTISLLALIGGCVLLFLDYSQYPDRPPAALSARPPGVKIERGGGAVPQLPQGGGKAEDKKDGDEKKAPDEKKADEKKDPAE